MIELQLIILSSKIWICWISQHLYPSNWSQWKLLFGRYGDLYTEKNVAISGIHTHAGPGGYLQYVTYIITSLGFVRQSFDVLVDGIEKSIVAAHKNLQPGSIFVSKGKWKVHILTTSFLFLLHCTAALDLWSFVFRSLGFIGIIRKGCWPVVWMVIHKTDIWNIGPLCLM